jgi:integrase
MLSITRMAIASNVKPSAARVCSASIRRRRASQILGHSQYSMTMNLYSHVIPALRRDAAKRMDALLATHTQLSGTGLSSELSSERRSEGATTP